MITVTPKMIIFHIRPGEEPLDQQDIEICQRVFDSVSSERRVPRGCEEAAMILGLYRHGVKDGDSLLKMVRATR
jgi:hypothetical protein